MSAKDTAEFLIRNEIIHAWPVQPNDVDSLGSRILGALIYGPGHWAIVELVEEARDNPNTHYTTGEAKV